MKRQGKKKKTSPKARVTSARFRDGLTGIGGKLSLDERAEGGPGRPRGWTLSDARRLELMRKLTTAGFEEKWLRFMCARPEFGAWTDEDRELFVRSSAGIAMNEHEAALLVNSLSECVSTSGGVLDRLILVGASLLLACRLRGREVGAALENFNVWRRRERKPYIKDLEPRDDYRALMTEIQRLSGMTESQFIDRACHFHGRARWLIARYKELAPQPSIDAHGHFPTLRDPKVREELEGMILEDRAMNRIPQSIVHPHEMALALSDLPMATPEGQKGTIVPYVHCSAPGCTRILDASFFRQAQGRDAPAMTICTEHSLHYWTIIEKNYPGGLMGLLKGRDAEGFDLASHWQENFSDDDRPRVRPTHYCQVKLAGFPFFPIYYPELNPRHGGVWAELHQQCKGRFDGVRYCLTAPNRGIVTVTPEAIMHMTDAVIIRHAQDTLPLLVTGEPFMRWGI